MNDNRLPGTAPLGVNQQLAQLIDTTRKPNGFAKLSTTERRMILAAMLSSMVPADGKIKEVELEKLRDRLRGSLQLSAGALRQALNYVDCGISVADLRQAAQQLPELLSIEDRVSLVGALWELALCDKNLDPMEEALIYSVADNAQVPRKRVAEAQSRAARNV